MINSYFELIRSGINTTYQDKGRENLYHIGIPYSGVMDNRNFLIANKLVNNNLVFESQFRFFLSFSTIIIFLSDFLMHVLSTNSALKHTKNKTTQSHSKCVKN